MYNRASNYSAYVLILCLVSSTYNLYAMPPKLQKNSELSKPYAWKLIQFINRNKKYIPINRKEIFFINNDTEEFLISDIANEEIKHVRTIHKNAKNRDFSEVEIEQIALMEYFAVFFINPHAKGEKIIQSHEGNRIMESRRALH